jgi:hypothetical protein
MPTRGQAQGMRSRILLRRVIASQEGRTKASHHAWHARPPAPPYYSRQVAGIVSALPLLVGARKRRARARVASLCRSTENRSNSEAGRRGAENIFFLFATLFAVRGWADPGKMAQASLSQEDEDGVSVSCCPDKSVLRNSSFRCSDIASFNELVSHVWEQVSSLMSANCVSPGCQRFPGHANPPRSLTLRPRPVCQGTGRGPPRGSESVEHVSSAFVAPERFVKAGFFLRFLTGTRRQRGCRRGKQHNFIEL